MKRLVQWGAGNIGRSFIGQIFARNGYDVVFIDIDTTLVNLLNERRSYTVEIVSDTVQETIEVQNVSAVDGTNQAAVISAIVHADVLSVSVGKTVLPKIAPLLAQAIVERYLHYPSYPLDVIIAENIHDGAAQLASFLYPHMPQGFLLSGYVGLVETSIGKMVPIQTSGDPLIMRAEPFNTLIVDRLGFKNQIPECKEIEAVSPIAAYVDRKLFIHNLGHAAAAYFGYRRYPQEPMLARVLEDPVVFEAVRSAMRQSRDGLLTLYPDAFTASSLDTYIEDLLQRFANHALGDTVFRIGRDLPRKLRHDDRLMGIMLAISNVNLPFDHIARAYINALLFAAKDEQGNLFVRDREFLEKIEGKSFEETVVLASGLSSDSIPSVIMQTLRRIHDESKVNGLEITGDGHRTLMELLFDHHDITVNAPCGANGLCGKCLVRCTDTIQLCYNDDDARLISTARLHAGYRLACRTVLPAGYVATVEVPKDFRDSHKVVASFDEDDTIQSSVEDGLGSAYGCAIDIGTTTVVVYLVDLDRKKIVGYRTALNNQKRWGADVISRIQHVAEHPSGLIDLQKAIIGQLDHMIGLLCETHHIPKSKVVRISAVGNPTMIHLVVGADPIAIASAPFTCAFTDEKLLDGNDIRFSQFPKARIHLPGFVSAYIGSDVTAGIHSCAFTFTGKRTLYIDIGTNGEIALWDGQVLHCCSSAAGPAFEGANIICGTGAIEGAIDKLWKTNDVSFAYSTLNSASPIGICGSGIIDCMALLLDLRLVDETGAMVSKDDSSLIRNGENGSEFVLDSDIVFTNRDVREVQLAKAAIAAGCATLLEIAHLAPADLESIIIAGGFGSYIDIASALRIGLLPKVDPSIIKAVGNAAGKGALEDLLSEEARRTIEAIRVKACYHELSTSQLFQHHYIEHMMFDEGV